jgi:hypothetical protein
MSSLLFSYDLIYLPALGFIDPTLFPTAGGQEGDGKVYQSTFQLK